MHFETNRDKKAYFHSGDCICPPHFHHSIEILYVTKGNKTVFLDGKKYELHENEVLFCTPYMIHEYPTCQNTTQMVVTAPTEFCESFDHLCRTRIPDLYIIKDSDGSLLKLISQLEQRQNEILFTGIINVMLGKFVDSVNFHPIKDAGEKSLAHKIAEYLEEHYAEDISLSSIAEKFGYSKNYFSSLFKRYFRTGLTQYVNYTRVRKSLPFLESNTISSIYLAVGFNSPQQYFLNFKKYYGCSPKDYIKTRRQ